MNRASMPKDNVVAQIPEVLQLPISMVKAADFKDRSDIALSGRHDWTGNRRVLVQRQVSPGVFAIRTEERDQLSHAASLNAIT